MDSSVRNNQECLNPVMSVGIASFEVLFPNEVDEELPDATATYMVQTRWCTLNKNLSMVYLFSAFNLRLLTYYTLLDINSLLSLPVEQCVWFRGFRGTRACLSGWSVNSRRFGLEVKWRTAFLLGIASIFFLVTS